MPRIEIINASTVLTDVQVAAMVPPLQYQISNHFERKWHILPAVLAFVPKGQRPTAGAWWLSILDDADVAGALGYHDVTAAGLPLGKVFAKLDQSVGLSVSCTTSHELLEMLADPDINTAQQAGARFWATEVCDPVEADADGYAIDGMLVSNFILPAWFDPTSPGPYDYRGVLSQPLSLRPGGYASYLALKGGQGWSQVQAQMGADGRRHPRPLRGLRRERRARREAWRHSTVRTAD